MKLKDKVALITGGSSGIGRAAAVAMVRQGAKVALTARRAERCQEAVDEIEGMGGEALALPGDVADAEHVKALVAATVERWGRLDIVVPNAGINGVFAPIEDITPEEWDQTQQINVRGTFLTVKYAPSPTCVQSAAAASSSSPQSTATGSSPTSASPPTPAPKPPR